LIVTAGWLCGVLPGVGVSAAAENVKMVNKIEQITAINFFLIITSTSVMCKYHSLQNNYMHVHWL